MPLLVVTPMMVLAGIFAACCGPNQSSSGDHDISTPRPGGTAVKDNRANTASNLTHANQPSALRTFANPWTRAKAGDMAIYRTARGEETWTLVVDELGQRRVRIAVPTIGLDGEPGDPDITLVTVEELAAQLPWWTGKHLDAAPKPVTLPGGVKVPETHQLAFNDRELIVSESVPFDGVLMERAAGMVTPVRELLSFTRGR